MGSSSDESDEDVGDAGPTLYDKPRPAPTRVETPTTPATVARTPATAAPSTTMVTAADALRDEEVARTRVFIRLGWGVTAAGLGAIPFVDGDADVTIAYVAALVLGVIVSAGYHQAFRDPRRFTPRAMLVLGVMSTFNTHVAILFFGAFTLAPVLIVIGLHFMGRSELPARRAVYATAAICHAAIAVVLIAGWMPDPGVFATGRPLPTSAYVIGALYVQACYGLAYYTGKIQRTVSLRSIEQLRRATRVASQRAALLDELRADLARAQQQGAGRYTGERLGGYRLGAIIGRGAHGEVYAAIHVETEAEAAIKLLRREQLADRTTFERFVREVKATAAVSSPHIVRVVATSEPGAALPFLAMERLTGMTLADQLRRRATLPTADVVALVTQVGAAIDAAAAAGIVHRDLKPHNLFAAGATWKVLDYGVAALADGAGELTRGGVVGTPHYMAPEQARGERVDHRADLYALGAIAYRALTGRNPFGGADTAAVLYNVVHAMPLAPSALAPELAADVDRWTALALAKDRARRWATGAALAAALAAAVAGELAPESRAAADAIVTATPWRVAT
jgi:eukaryotic-like serine/threonine-protein kinase